MTLVSTSEPLFLDPGHADVAKASAALAAALGLQHVKDKDGHYLGTRRLSESLADVGGRFEINDWQGWTDLDPSEVTESDVAVFDELPLVWMLMTNAGSLEEQASRARGVFDLVVERLRWAAILTHDFDRLLVTYDPERGVREFPPGTPSDGTGREVWG